MKGPAAARPAPGSARQRLERHYASLASPRAPSPCVPSRPRQRPLGIAVKLAGYSGRRSGRRSGGCSGPMDATRP